MIKVQVQAYSDADVSKYVSYNSSVAPSIGDTIKLSGKYYEVKSVTWFVTPTEFAEDEVNEVHVSAKLKD